LAKATQATHTSQTSTSAIVSLPASVPTASNRYRSVNDYSVKDISKNPVRYRLNDTPGHGKLRQAQGLSELVSMATAKDKKLKLRAVIFMVDTAALTEEETRFEERQIFRQCSIGNPRPRGCQQTRPIHCLAARLCS
jgi:signal recognition particle receptor subunit beta